MPWHCLAGRRHRRHGAEAFTRMGLVTIPSVYYFQKTILYMECSGDMYVRGLCLSPYRMRMKIIHAQNSTPDRFQTHCSDLTALLLALR